MRPRGLLFDYGGTLVEEISVDHRAGNQWLLSRALDRPSHVTLDDVIERARLVDRELACQRDQVQLETPWPTMTRLIWDFLGVRFDDPMADLEIGFWKASMHARPMPGVREALEQFRRLGIWMGVVSNTSFSERVIRYELEKHGLAEHLAFVMVSSEYCVRKPAPLLFETAAKRLGIEPADIWFVGDRLDTDVAGASAAGMTSVWLNAVSSPAPESHGAHRVASSWEDLLRQVTRSVETPGHVV
jgi:HAD superfamily hydrolase (TIGR01662 family)